MLSPEFWNDAIYALKQSSLVKDPNNIKVYMVADFSTPQNLVCKVKINQDDKSMYVIIKTRKKQTDKILIKQEYENIKKFHQQYNFENTNFNCVNIIHYCEYKNILILQECVGENFFSLIKKECFWFSNSINQKSSSLAAKYSGSWLDFIETNSLSKTNKNEIYNKILDEIRSAKQRLQTNNAVPALLFTFKLCKKIILNDFSKLQATSFSTYLAHGDFHPGNIFFNPNNQIDVIDLQDVNYQLLGYDAQYFQSLMILSFGMIKSPTWKIFQIKKAFFNGYKQQNKDHQQIKIIKAQIVIKTLVYLSSIYPKQSYLKRIINYIDIVKLLRWLNKS